MSNNNLVSLPLEIGYLINLEELWLYDNNLVSLPLEIGYLINLVELWLYDDKLKQQISNLLPNTIIY